MTFYDIKKKKKHIFHGLINKSEFHKKKYAVQNNTVYSNLALKYYVQGLNNIYLIIIN